jgi:type II secretory pathway pseudopilin PulG
MRPRAEGFALLAVLALLAVVGLYTAATLQDALFGTVLAGARVSQQRAFLLAELGIQDAMRDIAGPTPVADFTRQLQPLPDEQGDVTVVLRSTGAASLPAGFSAGRFVVRQFEIESTGRAARGARAVQVQGVARVLPQAAPPVTP